MDLLVVNGLNLLAVAGLVLLAAGSRPIMVIGGVVVAAALVITAWLLRRQRQRRENLLVGYLGPRIVLLVAVAVAGARRRPEDLTWVALAAGLALLTVLAEPTIRVLLASTEPVAVNLPGVRPVPVPPVPPSVVPVATVVVVVAWGVLAVVAGPGWAYVGVAAVAGLLALALIGHAVRANVISRQALAGLPAALRSYQPAFAVYFGGQHGARYQLGMWLPYLERLGRPFVVITRAADTVPVIMELTAAPVLVPKRSSALGGLERLVVPSMRAAFYLQGSRANLGMLKFRQLTHVWLNHGDSDKLAGYSGRHKAYDKVFVAGQQGVDRYAAHGIRIPRRRFEVVGRPQIEDIEVRDEPLPASAPRTVLYAPTWRGGRPATDYSSLPLGGRIVTRLLARGATVIFRPHPLSYSDPLEIGLIGQIHGLLEADRRRSGRSHVWGPRAERDWGVPECINASDALITDVSAIASDYLASGKPFAMVATRAPGEEFRREFPMGRVAYLIEKDLSTLDAALDGLSGTDPLAEARRAYRRYCLGDQLGEHAADEFLRVAGAIVAGSPRRRR